MAAQNYLQKSNLSDEYSRAELQQFQQSAQGLAHAYHIQTEANCQQVAHDRERGLKVNLELRSELVSSAQKYDHLEANATLQIQRLNETAVHWHSESEHEARVAIRNSEHTNDAVRRCTAAENALRQQPVPSVPQNHAELRGIIDKVEQDALNHVLFNEQHTETQLAHSSKYTRLLNEEPFAKHLGM